MIFFLHSFLWVLMGYLFMPNLPIFKKVLRGLKSKIIFSRGFDPLDIRAQQDFFSQNARLIKEHVCANFEEKNPRGTLIDQKY